MSTAAYVDVNIRNEFSSSKCSVWENFVDSIQVKFTLAASENAAPSNLKCINSFGP